MRQVRSFTIPAIRVAWASWATPKWNAGYGRPTRTIMFNLGRRSLSITLVR